MRFAGILLWVVIFFPLYAQETFLRHYSINEGLASAENYSVFQDRKGFIWIASDMGVNRFDGYRFKIFTTEDGLTDNTIFKFHEDSKGRIWFYTFSGSLCYFLNDTIYGKDFSINEDIRKFINPGYITSLQVDEQDTILLGTTKGLLKIIPGGKTPNDYWSEFTAINNNISYLLPDGYIEMQKAEHSNTLITIHQANNKPHAVLGGFDITSYVSFGEPNKRFLTIHGTLSYTLVNLEDQVIRHVDVPDVIFCSFESDTTFWIASRGKGVRMFSTNDFTQPSKEFLSSFSVTSVLKDRENGYWFTTLEDGLYYLPSNRFLFYPQNVNNLQFKGVSLVAAPDNKVWIVTTQNILEGNRTEKLREIYPDILELFPKRGYNYLWNAYFYDDAQVWISTNSGIAVLSQTSGMLNSYIDMYILDPDIEYDSRQLIKTEKSVWSINLSTLRKIDPESQKVVKTILLPARSQAICEANDGSILIGSINGLYKYENDSLHYEGASNSLFKNRIVDIKRKETVTAISTRGAGLLILHQDSIYQITTENGLLSNLCRSIFIDNDNVIWVASNRGLNSVQLLFEPLRYRVTSYSNSDGLQSNDIEHVIKSGNRVWMMSKKGIITFVPDDISENNVPPPVYISTVRIDNVTQPLDDVIELSYDAHFLNIDFVGLTYKNAGNQTYKYRLEGYDTSYVYTQNPSVQFTQLPPGNYKFSVVCVNNSGVESAAPATLKFIVNAPFYKEWWFGIVAFVASVSGIVAISILLIRRIRKRERSKTELNRKIANLELQALRAQMNPHFIFNCLNAIQDFILSNDAETAKRYLSSFAKLIRKTLNSSRSQTITLSDEIEFLQLYLELESMRYGGKFNFYLNLSDDLKYSVIEIPSMLLQPFIENAIRHGRIGNRSTQGNLTINFSKQDNAIVCRIDDNGVGFNHAEKKTASSRKELHALEIINDRIRTLNEINHTNIRYTIIDKRDTNTNESGTLVELYIPINLDNI